MKTFLKLYRETCREQIAWQISAKRHFTRPEEAYCLSHPEQSFYELFYFRLEEWLGLAI